MTTTNQSDATTGVPETGTKPAAGLGFNQDEDDGWDFSADELHREAPEGED